jgi:hypothetical protein
LKSRPKRGTIAVAATLASFIGLAIFFLLRHSWRTSAQRPENAERMARLRSAWQGSSRP